MKKLLLMGLMIFFCISLSAQEPVKRQECPYKKACTAQCDKKCCKECKDCKDCKMACCKKADCKKADGKCCPRHHGKHKMHKKHHKHGKK